MCCRGAVHPLLKIAVSPAVHFCFERNKPDLLSGLNAEEGKKEWKYGCAELLAEEENDGFKSVVSFLGRGISHWWDDSRPRILGL